MERNVLGIILCQCYCRLPGPRSQTALSFLRTSALSCHPSCSPRRTGSRVAVVGVGLVPARTELPYGGDCASHLWGGSRTAPTLEGMFFTHGQENPHLAIDRAVESHFLPSQQLPGLGARGASRSIASFSSCAFARLMRHPLNSLQITRSRGLTGGISRTSNTLYSRENRRGCLSADASTRLALRLSAAS